MSDQHKKPMRSITFHFDAHTNTLDYIAALIALAGVVGVLYSFIIGKHFLIPTVILISTICFVNLSWYGLQGARWAKTILFWGAFTLNCHAFFALFWAKKYREILGGYFEPSFIGIILVLSYLVFGYAKKNKLFQRQST